MRPAAFRFQGYDYQRRKLPGPGAQNIAFTDLVLDAFSPIGRGTQIMQQPMPAPAGLYAPPAHLIGLSGIGGVEVVFTDEAEPLIANQPGAGAYLG
jgi:hypothetical protein